MSTSSKDSFLTSSTLSVPPSVLRRLMYASVKTGSITAGFAILSLLFYTIQPNDNISVFFSLSLGRLYSISMLANLNARHSNDGTSRGPSSGDATSSHGRSEGRSGKSRTSKTKGIKITSETVTRVDDNTDLDLEEQGDAIQLSARRKTEKVSRANPTFAFTRSHISDISSFFNRRSETWSPSTSHP